MLYLGELAPNQVASIIKISQADSATMQALANNRDIFWQDKRAYLNQAFKEAKEQAAWLKSFLLLSLDYFYGKYLKPKQSIRILFIPGCFFKSGKQAFICCISIVNAHCYPWSTP